MPAKSKRTEDSPDAPIKFRSWTRAIRKRAAKPAKKKLALLIERVVADPRRRTTTQVRRRKGSVELIAQTSAPVLRHVFPPSIKTVRLGPEQRQRALKPESLTGYRPEHLAVRPVPDRLPRELRVARPWRRKGKRRDNLGEPGTVFAPDTRYVFSDIAFPWCTCGRVETAAGWGSGVMIGPRHLMTASHAINWGPNNTAGWVKFTPLQFDTSEPFGSAWATTIYWWQQVNGSDGVSSNEAAFDYVVCVLDRRLGDATGWMGSRGYSSSWNGGAYWAHIGYPSDLGGGSRPIFHGNGAIDSTTSESTSGRSSFRMMHRNDYWPGQSGGPAFGWWDGEPWPRVVGIYSAVNGGGPGGPNANGGGNPLPDLINHARGVAP
jgi:V8-like Glu-specific endopeptidase